MKCTIIFALLLSGCSFSDKQDKVDAMKEFIKGCSVPISATLTLSNSTNTVTMTCANLGNIMR